MSRAREERFELAPVSSYERDIRPDQILLIARAKVNTELT
jgi:hypothetical protein